MPNTDNRATLNPPIASSDEMAINTVRRILLISVYAELHDADILRFCRATQGKLEDMLMMAFSFVYHAEQTK